LSGGPNREVLTRMMAYLREEAQRNALQRVSDLLDAAILAASSQPKEGRETRGRLN
jgi:uncharacterized membrane protein